VKSDEVKKSKPFVLIDSVEYVNDSVLTKMVVSKTTGEIKVVAFGAGTAVNNRTSAFDTFVQVIEGSAEINIDDKPNTLAVGQCMIIPAHRRTSILAHVRFKIVSTVIKSGYEELDIL
jgi:quercetin dioxygenase-like cupin family protein